MVHALKLEFPVAGHPSILQLHTAGARDV